MKLKVTLIFAALFAIVICFNSDAESKYSIIKVSSAGWIKGKVSHINKDLKVPNLEVNRDAKVCGDAPRKIEAVDIGSQGELRNVVVYLKDINAGSEFRMPAEPPSLSQNHCTFEPHVQVVPPFASIRILNNDDTLHGVHAFQYNLGTKFVLYPQSVVYPAKTLFNIAMVAERKESFQQLGEPGIVKVICEAGHYWMTSYFLVMPHPYFGKVDSQGNYVIENVPPGKYTLVAWHEYFGTIEQPIEVRANQPVVSNFLYKEEL